MEKHAKTNIEQRNKQKKVKRNELVNTISCINCISVKHTHSPQMVVGGGGEGVPLLLLSSRAYHTITVKAGYCG